MAKHDAYKEKFSDRIKRANEIVRLENDLQTEQISFEIFGQK